MCICVITDILIISLTNISTDSHLSTDLMSLLRITPKNAITFKKLYRLQVKYLLLNLLVGCIIPHNFFLTISWIRFNWALHSISNLIVQFSSKNCFHYIYCYYYINIQQQQKYIYNNNKYFVINSHNICCFILVGSCF